VPDGWLALHLVIIKPLPWTGRYSIHHALKPGPTFHALPPKTYYLYLVGTDIVTRSTRTWFGLPPCLLNYLTLVLVDQQFSGSQLFTPGLGYSLYGFFFATVHVRLPGSSSYYGTFTPTFGSPLFDTATVAFSPPHFRLLFLATLYAYAYADEKTNATPSRTCSNFAL